MAYEKVLYCDLLKSFNDTISYDKLLSNQEWYEKRLSIIDRDNGQCQLCKKDSNLHVHHKEYIVGYLPWAYSNDVFQTLCSDCHNSIHSDPKTVIPIYIIENEGKILFNGTPCNRCAGVGGIN